MLLQSPLTLSYLLLSSLGTQISVSYPERIPPTGGLVVVSNHRSFMDAPVLMAALRQPIRFACHHYMGQVPVLRELVNALGCFPLDSPEQGQRFFFVKLVNCFKPGRRSEFFLKGRTQWCKKLLLARLESFSVVLPT